MIQTKTTRARIMVSNDNDVQSHKHKRKITSQKCFPSPGNLLENAQRIKIHDDYYTFADCIARCSGLKEKLVGFHFWGKHRWTIVARKPVHKGENNSNIEFRKSLERMNVQRKWAAYSTDWEFTKDNEMYRNLQNWYVYCIIIQAHK